MIWMESTFGKKTKAIFAIFMNGKAKLMSLQ